MKKQPYTIDELFSLLEEGEGWAYVNSNNVNELRTFALERGNQKLEQELRDWR